MAITVRPTTTPIKAPASIDNLRFTNYTDGTKGAQVLEIDPVNRAITYGLTNAGGRAKLHSSTDGMPSTRRCRLQALLSNRLTHGKAGLVDQATESLRRTTQDLYTHALQALLHRRILQGCVSSAVELVHHKRRRARWRDDAKPGDRQIIERGIAQFLESRHLRQGRQALLGGHRKWSQSTRSHMRGR